jgi:hypothetical protein
MHPPCWRPAFIPGCVLALAAAPRGQTEPLRPTFDTRVDHVAVPVRGLDRRGEFVRGLTAADFRVREDGKAQEIATFTAVDIPFSALTLRPSLCALSPEAS